MFRFYPQTNVNVMQCEMDGKGEEMLSEGWRSLEAGWVLREWSDYGVKRMARGVDFWRKA